jgi:hypothetical protein
MKTTPEKPGKAYENLIKKMKVRMVFVLK